MNLRRQPLTAEILDPGRGFEPARLELELRWDPLTGHTSRVLPAANLLPQSQLDLALVAEETRAGCPFCSEALERATPKLLPEISPEGRIRRGDAVLFPNLLPYSTHSSVSVYSPERHFLPLAEMTPRLVADNLAAQVAFARAVNACAPDALWVSINANHMPPSGSSIFHPHLQGSVNPVPTTAQRLLAEVPAERFRDYVDTERRERVRYLGGAGAVEWLAAFAPLGPAELRAFVFGVASPVELDDDMLEEIGHGIATALGLYAELGFESFNLALYGAPGGTAGYPLNLRLICRSNLADRYRSDATWLERLHWEAAVDLSPEELADRAGDRFR